MNWAVAFLQNSGIVMRMIDVDDCILKMMIMMTVMETKGGTRGGVEGRGEVG